MSPEPDSVDLFPQFHHSSCVFPLLASCTPSKLQRVVFFPLVNKRPAADKSTCYRLIG